MKRILVICPSPNDGTSFYRGVGPLSRLSKDSKDIQCAFTANVEYANISMVDLVFMQRPFLQPHVQVAEMTRHHNVPLWVDFDDDLFSVTPDNPTFDMYGAESTRKQVAKVIAMADVVTVSTEHLKQQYEKLNKRVIVVPNAIDDYQWEKRKPRPKDRPKMVFWRGSSTHQRDLMTVAQELVDASHDPARADWTFHFQGYNPWWITEQMRSQNTVVAPMVEPVQYMRFLEKTPFPIMVVPLLDNLFNRSKSNCSWIEGAFAGAAVIAPDMPEFQRPGVLNYKNDKHFGEILRQAMSGEIDIAQVAEEGWTEVKRAYTLSRVNHLRAQIVDQICSRPRGFA